MVSTCSITAQLAEARPFTEPIVLLSDHVLLISLGTDVLHFSNGETGALPNSSGAGERDKNGTDLHCENNIRYRQIYETLNHHSFNKSAFIKQITILEFFFVCFSSEAFH